MEENGAVLKKGRPPLEGAVRTVKFSLSMTEEMREGIESAVEAAAPSKDGSYNASIFVREAIGEKLERTGF